MTLDLKDTLKIFKLYEVERACKKDGVNYENDAEHSWSLAYLFTLLIPELAEEFAKLDLGMIYQLITIHDISEIGTGDFATWNKKSHNKESEQKYLEKYFITDLNRKDLYDLVLLLDLPTDQQPIEVKIVKSIDRIAPVILRISTGIGWHDIKEREHTSVERLDSRQLPRHKFSKTMLNLYNDLRQYALENNLIYSENNNE